MIALLLPLSSWAASPSLALGYTHREQRDLHASPVRYSGRAPTLQLGLDGETLSGWIDLAGVHWRPAGIGHRTFQIRRTDPLTGEDTSFVVDAAQWGQAGRIGLQGAWPVGPVRLGPRLSTTAHYAPLAQGIWALFEASLDARVAFTTGEITLAGWIPVVAVHTRMPYGLDPLVPGRSQVASFFASGTTLQSWGQRQALGADLAWRHPGQAWDVGLKASVGWSHSAIPDHLYALDMQLLATVWRNP